MSLIQNFESATGLSVKEAYHKIIKAQVDYITDTATFLVAIYLSQDDRAKNRTPLYIRKVTINEIGDRLKLREKLYVYLKTESNDYQESTDI